MVNDLSFTEKNGCKEGADYTFWGSCALHASFCLLHLAFHVDLVLQRARRHLSQKVSFT